MMPGFLVWAIGRFGLSLTSIRKIKRRRLGERRSDAPFEQVISEMTISYVKKLDIRVLGLEVRLGGP